MLLLRQATVRERAGGLASLADSCRRAARAHGVSVPRAARRVARLKVGQGFRPDEALVLGLLDARTPEAELDRYVSKRRLMQYLKPLNPRPMAPLTEDKALFNRFASASGLPVATLLAVHHRATAGWAPGGRVLAGRAAWTRLIADELPGAFVIKPASGYWGLGVHVLRREDERFRDLESDGILGPGEIVDLMAHDRRFGTHVIEERLVNHAALTPLIGGEALHTVRVSTLVGRDGRVEVLAANVRLAAPGRVADNWGNGSHGTILANVDVAAGTLHEGIALSADRVGAAPVAEHPVTGTRLKGFPVPLWDDLVALVRRAATAFLPLRALGWDVALTPRGPVLVEANISWDPPNPSPDMRRLMHALGDA